MSALYIHIPFCHSKCAYCDFFSTPVCKDEGLMIDALSNEYRLRSTEIEAPIKTLYLGGGTPSILSADSLNRLVSTLPMDDVEEFTIEVNPEDVTIEKVRAWRQMGVNRISMGIQSLDDKQLRLIGRRHDAATAIRAVQTLREGGIGNLSLDLIYGLPTQTLQSWERSLNMVLDMHPEHLSAYMLTYEPRTRLTAMLRTGKIEAVDEDTCIEMYKALTVMTRDSGYIHYEISNFALDGYHSRHNSSYWDGTPYLGLGPSAHSFDGKRRRVNPPDIRRYTEQILAGKTVYEVEEETKADRFNDKVITGLRTAQGLDFSSVPVMRRKQLLTSAYPHIKTGDLVITDNHLRIPEQSWLISDTILRDLIQ